MNILKKACPMCGGLETHLVRTPKGLWRVACSSVDCPAATRGYANEEDAIKAWEAGEYNGRTLTERERVLLAEVGATFITNAPPPGPKAHKDRLTRRDPTTGKAYIKPLDPDCGSCSIHRAECQHHRELVAETLAKYEDLQPTPEKLAAELLAHEKRAMALEREREMTGLDMEALAAAEHRVLTLRVNLLACENTLNTILKKLERAETILGHDQDEREGQV